jgi:hypothetical protein
MNFPGSQAGQSLIALLNVIVHFSERHCKYSNKSTKYDIFRKKFAKKVAYSPKKHYFCTRNEEDSRIR